MIMMISLSTSDASAEAHCITWLQGFIVLLKDRGRPSAISQLGSKGHAFPFQQEQWLQPEHVWLKGER